MLGRVVGDVGASRARRVPTPARHPGNKCLETCVEAGVPGGGRRVYLEEGGGCTWRSEAGLPGGGRRVDRVEGRRRQLPGVEDEAEGDEEEGVDEVEVEVEEDSHLAPAGPPSPTRQSNNQPV